MLFDWYLVIVIFIEFDFMYCKVICSWLCINMWFKFDGDVIGLCDLIVVMNLLNILIEFMVIVQYGLGVDQFV